MEFLHKIIIIIISILSKLSIFNKFDELKCINTYEFIVELTDLLFQSHLFDYLSLSNTLSLSPSPTIYLSISFSTGIVNSVNNNYYSRVSSCIKGHSKNGGFDRIGRNLCKHTRESEMDRCRSAGRIK